MRLQLILLSFLCCRLHIVSEQQQQQISTIPEALGSLNNQLQQIMNTIMVIAWPFASPTLTNMTSMRSIEVPRFLTTMLSVLLFRRDKDKVAHFIAHWEGTWMGHCCLDLHCCAVTWVVCQGVLQCVPSPSWWQRCRWMALSIKQGSRSAAENTLEFHTLATGSRWNEPALVYAFHQRLKGDMIMSWLATALSCHLPFP